MVKVIVVDNASRANKALTGGWGFHAAPAPLARKKHAGQTRIIGLSVQFGLAALPTPTF
jgi:hypothetical protein